jgi:hypothetical protein
MPAVRTPRLALLSSRRPHTPPRPRRGRATEASDLSKPINTHLGGSIGLHLAYRSTRGFWARTNRSSRGTCSFNTASTSRRRASSNTGSAPNEHRRSANSAPGRTNCQVISSCACHADDDDRCSRPQAAADRPGKGGQARRQASAGSAQRAGPGPVRYPSGNGSGSTGVAGPAGRR